MFNPQKIRPPHILFSLLILAIGIHVIFKLEPLIAVSWFGVVLFVAGFMITATGFKTFVKKDTPVRHSETPKALVTEGLYKYTRNPMYVGMMVLLFGVALMVGTWPFLAVPLLMFCVLNFVYIPWEEKTMAWLFKDDYRAYCKRVRRWL